MWNSNLNGNCKKCCCYLFYRQFSCLSLGYSHLCIFCIIGPWMAFTARLEAARKEQKLQLFIVIALWRIWVWAWALSSSRASVTTVHLSRVPLIYFCISSASSLKLQWLKKDIRWIGFAIHIEFETLIAVTANSELLF